MRIRAGSAPGRLRVSSPTITTPLVGVPEPFLAGHYMKVLCPIGGALGRQLEGWEASESSEQ